MSLKIDRLKSNLFNIPGWHTRKKIIVFESDDWGSIRIPSRETYNYLINLGYPIDKTPYSMDCLESNSDLTALLEILSSVKNINGKRPIFTLNNIAANPDFEMIKKMGFKEYYYELFQDTYKQYPDHDRSFDLLKEGVRNSLFRPQLHGREHLNINRWINSLKKGQPETIDLFNHSMFSLPAKVSRDDRRDFQRAFDYDNDTDYQKSCLILTEACKIFNDTWNFKSSSFIAPNFFWDGHIEKCLSENGVKYIQGQRAQFLTDFNGSYAAQYHFTGEKNRLGMVYLIRNCYFEPSLNQNKDWIDSCMKEIATAFLWRKPAIISTHRVNYIGSINPTNRDSGLRNLRTLLTTIIRKWPATEFISSDRLGDIIAGE